MVMVMEKLLLVICVASWALVHLAKVELQEEVELQQVEVQQVVKVVKFVRIYAKLRILVFLALVRFLWEDRVLNLGSL